MQKYIVCACTLLILIMFSHCSGLLMKNTMEESKSTSFNITITSKLNDFFNVTITKLNESAQRSKYIFADTTKGLITF